MPPREMRVLLACVLQLVGLANVGFATPRTPLVTRTTQGHEEKLTPKQVFEKYANSVVKIDAGDSQGTGFIVLDDRTVATCYHVIRGAQQIIVKTSNDQERAVQKVYFNEDKDAAILVLTKSSEHIPIPVGDYTKMSPGDELSIIGNPLGFLTQSLTTGIVSARRQLDGVNLLQMTAAISPGSSGSPVFNSSGQVVGFVSFHYTDGEALNVAVAIDEIKSVFDKPALTMAEFAKEEEAKSKERAKDSKANSEDGDGPEEFTVASASETLRAWHHEVLASLNEWESWLTPYYYTATAKSSDQKVIDEKLHKLTDSVETGLMLNELVKDIWKPADSEPLQKLVEKFESDAIDWSNAQKKVNTLLVSQPHQRTKMLDEKLSAVSAGYWQLMTDLAALIRFMGEREWVVKAEFRIDVTDPLVVYYHVCRLTFCVCNPADEGRCLISASLPTRSYPGGPGVLVALRKKGTSSWNSVATWVDFERLVLTWPRSTPVEIRVRANGKTYVAEDEVINFIAKK